MKWTHLFAAVMCLSGLAACAEDRNGPGYASQRTGYDVHADEYRHHSEDRGRDTYQDDTDRARDHNCPWHEQC